MAVMFAPLRNDGTMYTDGGIHDFTENNNNTARQYLEILAAQWLITNPTEPPLDTTIPGQAPGQLLCDVVVDYIAANEAGWSQPMKDLWSRIRVAVAAGARIESHTIAWRFV